MHTWRWHRRGGIWPCVVACVTFASVEAQAAEPSRRLDDAIVIEGGVCLERATLAKEVERRLGSNLLDARIRIEVREAASLRQASFVLYRDDVASGERELEHLDGDCSEITSAVGVSIAVAVQQLLLDFPLLEPGDDTAESDARMQTETKPETPSLPPQAKRKPAVRDPTESRVPARCLGVEVQPGLLFGALPGPALATSVMGEIRLAPAWVGRVGIFGAASVSLPLATGVASGQIAAGRGDLCRQVPLGGLIARSCAGVMIGVIRVAGEGYATSFEQFLPWPSPILRLDSSYPVGHNVRVSVGLDGAAPLVRRRLETTNRAGELLVSKSLPPVAILAGIGVRYTFR